MTWTDARVALLTRLWSEGRSASGIAAALGGASRSAVLGKLYRLGLLKSRKAAAAPRAIGVAPPPRGGEPAARLARAPQAVRRERPPQPPRTPWRLAAFRPLSGTEPRPWITRTVEECAFPVGGEGAATLACCAPAMRPRGYCARHHAVMFHTSASPERAPNLARRAA